MRYLVIHDVDAIQAYILATNRLREIRGASALIDSINRRDTRRLVHENGGEGVYFGGGAAAAEFNDSHRANKFCEEVSKCYADRTMTSSSTGVVVDYDDSDPEGFQKAVRQGYDRLRKKKWSGRRETQLFTGPYLKRCQHCGLFPAERQFRVGDVDESRFICASCSVKQVYGRFTPDIHRRIRRLIRPRRHGIEFPATLDDIGNAAKPSGYIGVIYADGNRMGDRFQKIQTRTALGHFSDIVDTATRRAISLVLARKFAGDKDAAILPVLVPLCGGDDLIVVVPAQHAMEIAAEYLREFQHLIGEKMKEEVKRMLGSREVSACAGVAIAKQATPMSALFELAHDLCRQAKRRSYDEYQQNREVACLDFQVVTTPTWGNVEETRREQFAISDDRRLTCRPYTLDETQALINAARELKQAKFPQGKLHDLYRSLWHGKHQATLIYSTISVRAGSTNDKHRRALDNAKEYLKVDLPPWKQATGQMLETPYADLVEIYPFVKEQE